MSACPNKTFFLQPVGDVICCNCPSASAYFPSFSLYSSRLGVVAVHGVHETDGSMEQTHKITQAKALISHRKSEGEEGVMACTLDPRREEGPVDRSGPFSRKRMMRHRAEYNRRWVGRMPIEEGV